MRAKSALHDASNRAVRLYEQTMGEAFPRDVELVVYDDTSFEAWVEDSGGITLLHMTTGVYDAVAGLWSEVCIHAPHLISPEVTGDGMDVDVYINDALDWLMLHELHHSQMGHLKYIGSARLFEAAVPSRLAALSRATIIKNAPIDTLPADEKRLTHYCLELQADDDSTDMMLGGFDENYWPEQRRMGLAIFSVMVLIEREDRLSGSLSDTHPKSATRIFQLIGHLAELWHVHIRQTGLAQGLTTLETSALKEEHTAAYRAFIKNVVMPVVHDAPILAAVLGEERIVDELGDPLQFIEDINKAKNDQWSKATDFQTVGAQQWAELVGFNSKLMKVLGLK
jgi:hypothetical protein